MRSVSYSRRVTDNLSWQVVLKPWEACPRPPAADFSMARVHLLYRPRLGEALGSGTAISMCSAVNVWIRRRTIRQNHMPERRRCLTLARSVARSLPPCADRRPPLAGWFESRCSSGMYLPLHCRQRRGSARSIPLTTMGNPQCGQCVYSGAIPHPPRTSHSDLWTVPPSVNRLPRFQSIPCDPLQTARSREGHAIHQIIWQGMWERLSSRSRHRPKNLFHMPSQSLTP